jgi:N-alpha-acetyltransferase 35, NatC auxiliary subunit
MDSGMLVPKDDHPPFDPLAPLLPEEICWILDRSFACEVSPITLDRYRELILPFQIGWLAGNTLSQTVYTLLYVHSLQDINPDLLPLHYFLVTDPRRPLELTTTVLRPAVFALLKSCDLVWRELSKRRVHDVSTFAL